jgi:hypothetical protein
MVKVLLLGFQQTTSKKTYYQESDLEGIHQRERSFEGIPGADVFITRSIQNEKVPTSGTKN